MVLRGVSVTALFAGILVYSAIFILIRHVTQFEGNIADHMRLGLLLFALPGILTALLSREKPLTVALLTAAIATPLCLVITHIQIFNSQAFWQEMAWLSSAMFWCVMGALTTMLWRELLRLNRQ